MNRRGLEAALRQVAGLARRLALGPRRETWVDRLVIAGGGCRHGVPSTSRVSAPLRRWREVRAGTRARLDARAIRHLCWEREIGTDLAFHAHLDGQGVELEARSLQGLLRSCHAMWSGELVAGPVVERVRARILDYAGPEPVTLRWKADLDWLLGRDGPRELAERLLSQSAPVREVCRGWGMDPRTRYVREAVRYAVRICRDRLGQERGIEQRLFADFLGWPDWETWSFKAEVATTVLRAVPAGSPARAAVVRFVLDDPRLGDPRQSRNDPAWRSVHDGAVRRIVRWVSEDDLDFFCGTVVPRASDAGSRRAFWASYVGAIRVSRVLLNVEDELRWEERRRRRVDAAGGEPPTARFGRVTGGDSALILSFDRVLVVEYARTGVADVYARDEPGGVETGAAPALPAREDLLDGARLRVARLSVEDEGAAALALLLAEYDVVARPETGPGR